MLHGLGQGTPAGANNRVKRLILKSFIGIGDEYRPSQDLKFVPTSPPTMSSKRGLLTTSQPEPKRACHDNADKTAPSGYLSVLNTSIQNTSAFQNPMYNNQMPSIVMPTTSMRSSALPTATMPTTAMPAAAMPAAAMPTAAIPSTPMPLENLNQPLNVVGSGPFDQNWAFLPDSGQTSPYPPIQQSQNMFLPSQLDETQLYPIQQSQLGYLSAQNGSMDPFSFQTNLSNQQHDVDNLSFLKSYQNGGLPQNHQNGHTPQSTENAHAPQSNFNNSNSPHIADGFPAPLDQSSATNLNDIGGGSRAPDAQT